MQRHQHVECTLAPRRGHVDVAPVLKKLETELLSLVSKVGPVDALFHGFRGQQKFHVKCVVRVEECHETGVTFLARENLRGEE